MGLSDRAMEKNPYYTINRYLMQICGVWPYDNTRLRYVRAALILGTFSVYIVCQLIPLFDTHNFEVLIRTGSSILLVVLCLLQFIAYLFNQRDIRHLLNHIFEEWQILKDQRELDILRKYANSSKTMTTLLLVWALLLWFILLLIHLVPIVVDRTANVSVTNDTFSTNELDANTIPYIFILLLIDFILTTTSTIAMTYMQHICAMLKVTSYRIEHSLNVKRHMPIPQKERLMFRRLIGAVDVHRKTIRSLQFALSSFKVTYFLLMALGVASFAINLLQAIRAAAMFDNAVNFVNSSYHVPVHLIYFFVLNYAGQLIQDHDVNVLETLYSIQWYMAPIKVQKLILFLMLRYTRNFRVILGGIFVVSLEGFVTLVSTSMSYFMVIYSTEL